MSKAPFENNEPDIYFEESLTPQGIVPHYHNMQQILFVWEGAIKITIDQNEYVGGPNSIFFISNLESHAVEILKYPYRRYVLSIPVGFSFLPAQESAILGILTQRPENFSHVIRPDERDVPELLTIFDSLVSECRDKRPGWQLMTACQITRLLIELSRFSPSSFPQHAASGITGTVLEMQKAIAQNFEEDLSLDGFAEKYFVSKYHLSREFKRITGYNFREYLILTRVSAAKDLLAHTDQPVSEVGLHAGYPNVNHFIRIFKSITGKSPYRYKKELPGQ